MKETVLVLLSVLIVVCGTLIMVSAEDEYPAQRLFFKAVQASSRIPANPELALPSMFTAVETDLQKLLRRYPDIDLAREAQLLLAETYLRGKKYDQTLLTVYKIINTYQDDRFTLSKAYFLRGSTYEQQDKWEKALREYSILRDEYSDTPFGLHIPLYIGDYYREQENYSQAEQAYQEAVRFYKKLARKNRKEITGYTAANLLMYAHMELDQYEQAGNVVEGIVNDYPGPLPFMQQLPNVDLIFIARLNQPEKAIGIYRKMQTNTEDPNLLKLLNQRIETLEAQR